MKISTQGLIALIRHEGIVLSRYKDSVGVWTIGVGHTLAAGGIDPRTFTAQLSLNQALVLLRTDISKYEVDARRAVTVAVEQHEFDALVSLQHRCQRARRTYGIVERRQPAKGRPTIPELHETAGNRQPAKRREQAVSNQPVSTCLHHVYPVNKEGKVLWSHGKALDATELLRGLKQAMTKPSHRCCATSRTAFSPY